MNCVTKSRGTAWTVTENVHAACWAAPSAAVQVTMVVPAGNDIPAGGVQVTLTGAVPPLVTGAAYVIATGWPPIELLSMPAGHERARPGGGGGGGAVGDPPQAAQSMNATDDHRARGVRQRCRKGMTSTKRIWKFRPEVFVRQQIRRSRH
jgi:hypothetical protein